MKNSLNHTSVNRYHRRFWRVAIVFICSLFFAAPHAQAQSAEELQNRLLQLEQALKSQKREMAEQQRALENQARVIAVQQEALDQLRGDVDDQRGALQQIANPPTPVSRQGGPRTQPAVYRTGQAPSSGQASGPQGRVAQAQAQAQQVPAPAQPAEDEDRPDVPVLAEQGGVLLRQGSAVIEPSVEYVHSDVTRVEVSGFTVLPAILIGSFELSDSDRDTVTGAVTGRYGVTDRFEIEAKVPYVYREDSLTGRPLGMGTATDTTSSVSGHGLGDVEIAAHYQINDGTGGWPFFVGNLRVKTPTGKDPFEVDRDPTTNVETELSTGTGFWSVEPSITAIFPTDPAVLFGNVSYLANLERDIGGGFGTIDPGDAVGFNFGMGISLNEMLSFSLSYDHSIIFETEQNGATIPGSSTFHVGRAIMNTSYKLSDRVGVNLSVAAGVTDDAPDVQLLLRVPIRLTVFD